MNKVERECKHEFEIFREEVEVPSTSWFYRQFKIVYVAICKKCFLKKEIKNI